VCSSDLKNEAFQLFETLLNTLRESVTQSLARIRPLTEEEQRQMMVQAAAQQQAPTPEAPPSEEPAVPVSDPEGSSAQGFVEDDPTTWGNPGRNEKCPCGSGKKFKHCHGRLT